MAWLFVDHTLESPVLPLSSGLHRALLDPLFAAAQREPAEQFKTPGELMASYGVAGG